MKIIPPIIAHRGLSALAPENTLSAFLKAKECGIQWVEFDVMTVASGEVIVFHDDTLDRTTNGIGQVIAQSYENIKPLDAGSWFHPSFKEEKIPTLQEVLSLLSLHQMSANIEIKAFPGQEFAVVDAVFDILADFKNMPILLSSFSLQALHYARKRSKEIWIGCLFDEWQSDWETICRDLNALSLHVNQLILNPRRAQMIKATHRLLLAYTVNDPLRAKELFAFGVDAIFSDCPTPILSIINQQKLN